MRVCIISDAWTPQVNGVVTTMKKMVAGLKTKGHEVLVIHPGLFKTLPCPTYPEIRLALKPQSKMIGLLNEFGPQAIHLTTEGPLGLAGRNYCVRRGLNFTTSICTRFPEYVELRTRIPASWLFRFWRWFHAPAQKTMVATDSLKKDLEGIGFKNLAPWGRGVDLDLFCQRPKDILPGPRPISLYMGRVAVEKNLEAFLSLDLPGSKVVIGDGPALNSLKRKFPQVRFLGRKTGLDLAQHVAAADVFVFPSLTDTFGVVLIEAMACGLPAAAYPVTGPKDVIVHGQTGWLDQNLGLAVEKALQMDPDRCRARAEEFSWQRSVDQFEANLAPLQ